MSGYSEYIMSASSSIADIVSGAGSAAAQAVTGAGSAVGQAAGQVATQVTEACHTVAQSAQQKLLSYKYEPARITGSQDCDSDEYPDTDEPVWMLGLQFSAKYDKSELRDLVSSRPWMTYRRDFPPIGESGLTSDQGWGCMLRCGQMVLAGALLDIRLGRDWRHAADHDPDPEYARLMEKFLDNKSAEYSIHQISLMGESVDKKPVGTWFGPNTVAQVLRKLCKYDPSNDVSVHVAMDNMMIISEVKQSCLQEQVKHSSDNNEDVSEEKSYSWKPLLLFISLRLGLTEINPVYKSNLKTCFSLPSSLGVIGGSPNHALYLVGVVEDEVLYLDPHTTQPCVSSVDDSYHISRPGRISISQLDPSLALCFLCITEQEFDNLCIAIQENLIERCQTPLFEMMLERPTHLYGRLINDTSADINVDPDDNTGHDYEQLNKEQRKDMNNQGSSTWRRSSKDRRSLPAFTLPAPVDRQSSHPRSSISRLSSAAFSNNSRSKSSGRDPRMLDLMKAFSSNNNSSSEMVDNKSEDQSVLSSVGYNSLASSDWSISSGFTSLLSQSRVSAGGDNLDQHQQLQMHPRSHYNFSREDDDRLSIMSGSSVLSQQSTATYLHQNSVRNDVVGSKRKYSSIAEAISDSDGDTDDIIDNLAKRPKTPVHSHTNHGEREKRGRRSWCSFVGTIMKLVLSISGLAIVIFSGLFCITLHHNYQCSKLRTLALLPSSPNLETSLRLSVLGQEMAAREIVTSLTKFQSLTQNHDSPSAALLILHGWTGVGKTHTANQLMKLLNSQHSSHFLSCPLITPASVSTIRDKISLTCGYSLLVLDDCDVEDDRVVDAVRSVAGGVVHGGDEVKSSGVVMVMTSSAGARSINKYVGEHIRSGGGDLSDITTETIQSVLSEDASPVVALQQALSAPSFFIHTVPFLPLTQETVVKCAQRFARDEGVKLSTASLTRIIEMQQFSNVRNVKIATTGCKQISSKIDMIIGAATSRVSDEL